MNIPREQNKPHSGGGSLIIPVNTDCVFTQLTITGRNTGTITLSARPDLQENDSDDFDDDDFESITDGVIDLAASPKKRTITIENKKISALKLVDSGAGNVVFLVRQWGRV